MNAVYLAHVEDSAGRDQSGVVGAALDADADADGGNKQ